MSTSENFNSQDLMVMSTVNSTIEKMDECLDIIKPNMTELFGKPYQDDFERLKEISKFERYAMMCKNVIGTAYSELLVGFDFTDEDNESEPMLVAQLFFSKDNSRINKAKNEIEKLDVFDFTDYDSDGYLCWFEKPLSDFLSSTNQFDDVCNWFIEKLEKIHNLETLTSLTWKK